MSEPTPTTENAQAAPKANKTFTGVVISDGMDKTRVIRTQRLIQHPLYKKYIRRDKKLYIHDERNESHVGDTIEVVEVTRPLSKLKRYRLRRIVERAK